MIKLKTFEIKSPFKNLDSLNLDFEKCNGITVLIGNNGSGKSNLIEALSSVFAGLYDHSFDPTFSYELIYEKDDAPIKILYDHTKSRSKYQYSVSDTANYLPNQIISVYSGEESRLWNRYYFKFYNEYMKDVISSRKSFNENQKMVFINKYYWNTALLTMLVSDLDIEDILGNKKIERIEFEFKSNNRDNITNYNDRSPNDVTRFAAEILEITSEITGSTGRRSITLEEFRTRVRFTHTELFKLLSISLLPKEDSWKLINRVELFFEDGFSTEELSEGEKKQILIKFITRIFSDDNSLLLMDEPDSHIHISNKEKIKNLLYDLEDQVHVQSILTTHSPTLTHCFENDNVYMLVNREGKVVIEDKTKQEIVNDLTSDFWNLQEQNIFNSSQKPISLFVEGKHDKIHIQNAFNALKTEYPELSFDIFNMNSANNIPPMMLGLRTSEVDYGKLFIGVFDDDEVGRTELSKTQSQFPDPRNQNKKRHQLGFYACKYPKHPDHRSNAFTVENMFESNHFEEAYKEALEQYRFNGKSLDSISDDIKDKAKNLLAEKSRDFETEDFKYFRPLFDQIKAIILDYETNYRTEDNAVEEAQAANNGQELYLFNNARGNFNADTNAFTLLNGSKINRNYTPSTREAYKQTRDTLISTLTHNIDGDEIEIQQDHEFESPSGAAKFVNGGNRNGWTSWKNAEGESLKQKYGDN